MGKVVAIPGIAAPKARIRQAEIVEILKEALEKARSGEIQGLALAWVDCENAVTTTWDTGKASANMMISATSRLAYRVLQAGCGE